MLCLLISLIIVGAGPSLGDNSPSATVVSSGKVIGTVITACNNVTFHTPPGDPYPTRTGKHLWLSDSHTPCLPDSSSALDYCRKVYSAVYPEMTVDHVVVDPFEIVPDILPWFPSNASSAIRAYLCLGPTLNTDEAHLDAPSPIVSTTEVPHPSSAPHRLPSLIDVHRVYFAEQFRHLWNRTHTNVSQIVGQLVQQTKGLLKLYQSNPEWVKYTVSEVLKKAHERLQNIWTAEEREWSVLEENQHQDLVSQLGSDEWAGENMFAFALQESHPDVNRIQDALAILLSRLANSVSEEVRHLKVIHSRQPWMLRLDFPTNNISQGITYLEQVHQALLKHVHVATMAINAFHSVMAKYTKNDTVIESRYKPTLVASYDLLQTNLFEAQRLLNHAKSTLLGNLATRMNSLFNHLNSTVKQNNPPSVANTSLDDWINSKHHAELAYIDLMVGQLLSPYVASIDLPAVDNPSKFIWQPVAHPIEEPQTLTETTEGRGWLRDHTVIFLTVVLCSVSLLSTFLFCFIRTLRSARLTSSDMARRRQSHFRSFLSRGGHKLKHLMEKSQQQWNSGTLSVWKVGPRVVVLAADHSASHLSRVTRDHDTEAQITEGNEAEIHGYMNPACTRG